ncbi:MAG: hypothetical protein N4A72_20555 [Bacteroidales bacterium]|jgi:hypothetical protein|nr:hypothetical protein [Bacteroidales bacterium]
MNNLNLSIEKIKCLRTSIEISRDEIYCAGVFIPITESQDNVLPDNGVRSFVTSVSKFSGGYEKLLKEDFDFSFGDDYMLILHLIEKDDGEIYNCFASGECTKEIANIDIWENLKNIVVKEVGNIGVLGMLDYKSALMKLVTKALPGFFKDLFIQVKRDDILEVKRFTKANLAEFADSPNGKTFLFKNVFAKYEVTIKLNIS